MNVFNMQDTTSFVAWWNIIASHLYTIHFIQILIHDPQSSNHTYTYEPIYRFLLFFYYCSSLSLSSIVGCRWCLLIYYYYYGSDATPNRELITSFPYIAFLNVFYLKKIYYCSNMKFTWIWLQWHPFWIDCMAFLSWIFVLFYFY